MNTANIIQIVFMLVTAIPFTIWSSKNIPYESDYRFIMELIILRAIMYGITIYLVYELANLAFPS